MKRWYFLAFAVVGVLLVWLLFDRHEAGLAATPTDSPAKNTRFLLPAVSPPPPSPASAPSNDAGLSYTYNAQGQLSAIRYSDGTVYTYTYDQRGNKIRESDRQGKTWSYVYDQSGNPLVIINPEGQKTVVTPLSPKP